MGDDAHFMMHGFCITLDALGLVGDVEPALQILVVGGDTGRAGVLVALEGLDATQCEHEAARGSDEIGAHADRPGNIAGCDELAARDDLGAIAQAITLQLVDYQRQALA